MSELRVDNIVDMGGSGAPKLRKGANVTGISTITQAVVGNATINAGGINATGIVTSSSNKFVGDFASGNITAGVITATSSVVASNITINSGGVNASGIVSATSYQGDGSNLTGVGLSIAPLMYNPPVSGVDASVSTGIGMTFNQRIFAGVGTVTLSLVSVGSTVVEVLGIGTAVTKTYTVTVQSTDSGNKYLLDGNQQYSPTLYPGGIYTFDQSDSSNNNHPLRFSITDNGTHGGGSEYTTGVETNGTPGSSGAYTRITVAADAPDTLYYYCTNHSGMGSNVSIGANFTFNNDADPPNVTATPKSSLDANTVFAISYPSGIFVKNDGSDFVGTAYTFDTGAQTFGQLWAAGWNYNGQLGQNSTNPAPAGGVSSPIQIPGTWSQVSSGGDYATAIKSDNTLWAWGTNEMGELGQNERNEPGYSSPVQIPGTTWSDVSTATGSDRAGAIKTDGTLWMWGRNDHGQLGQNSETLYSSPVQVTGTTWLDVEAGDHSTLALKTDGTLYSWGRSEQGSLGIPSIAHDAHQSSPVQIPGAWSGSKIAMDYNGCAIKTDGTLWVWGTASYGNLGQNDRTHRSSPTQIPGTSWNNVATRIDLVAATKTDGTLWVWGRNNDGALGLSSPSDSHRSSPTQIPGTTWAAISTKGSTMLASKTDGTLWNWGQKSGGRLGNNTDTYFSSPVQIPGTSWSTQMGHLAAGGGAHYYIKLV